MKDKDRLLGDPEIRQALRLRLSNEHAKQADTVFIEEFGICRGQGRIDLAVVNSLFHGYEIKSDRDSLRRLDSQVELYSKVLDRLVTDGFLPAQYGQPVPLPVRLLGGATHSWSGPLSHVHHTFLEDPATTWSGVRSPFLVGCHYAAISG